jgi:hypothetical protein
MTRIGKVIPSCFCKEAKFWVEVGYYHFSCPIHKTYFSWDKKYVIPTKARNLKELRKEIIQSSTKGEVLENDS